MAAPGDDRRRSGVAYDPAALDRVERRFWREIWESVPAEVAAEHGVEVREFGPVQATVVSALGQVGMLNLVLGAAEAGAVATATSRRRSPGPRSASTALRPGHPRPARQRRRPRRGCAGNGFEPAYAWMKFVRDPHPPRFPAPDGRRGGRGDRRPTRSRSGRSPRLGFGLPAWAAELLRPPARAGRAGAATSPASTARRRPAGRW